MKKISQQIAHGEAESTVSNSYLWANIMRIIAIFLVVLTHSITSHHDTITSTWWITTILVSISRIGVPLFVMLSGALLLGKQEKYITFFRKRAQKVLIPWITWSAFYVVWYIFFRGNSTEDIIDIFRLFYIVFTSQFWFLVMLAGLYLLTPVIRVITRYAKERDILYSIFIWIIFISIMPFIFKIISQANLLISSYTLQHVGYFILGYYLTTNNKKWNATMLLAFFLIALVGSTAEIYFFTARSNSLSSYTSYNLSPFIVLLTVTSFMLLFQFGISINRHMKNRVRKYIAKISDASFGIFLAHTAVLDYLQKVDIWQCLNNNTICALSSILIRSFVVFSLSFLAIILLKKLPFANRIVG